MSLNVVFVVDFVDEDDLTWFLYSFLMNFVGAFCFYVFGFSSFWWLPPWVCVCFVAGSVQDEVALSSFPEFCFVCVLGV